MFCGKCGKQIEDGKAFCPFCGAAVEAPSEAVNEPAAEVLANSEAPAPQMGYEAPAEPVVPVKKKGGKAILISAIVAAVAVLVALAIVFDIFGILGFVTKTFGSDSDYFRYAEKNALETQSGSIYDAYDDILELYEDGEAANETEIKLNIGDSAESLLKTYLGSIDLSEFKNLSFKLDTNLKDGKFAADLNGKVAGEDMGAKVVLDSKANKRYLELPGEETKPAAVELPAEFKNVIPAASDIDYSEYLPNGKELKALVQKYSDIIFDNIDDVQKIGSSITVGGITESCSALQLDVDEKLIYTCVLAIIEECRDDEEVKEMLEDIQALIVKLGGSNETNLYNSLLSALNSGQATIQENLTKLAGQDGKKLLTIVSYVSSSSEVIGREIYSYNGDEKTLYSSTLRATDGDKFALQTKANADGDQVIFDMAGTGDFGSDYSFSGTVCAVVDGETLELLKLEGKDVICDGNDYSGSIVMKLGKGIASKLEGMASTFITLLNPSIEFKYNITDDVADFSINLLKDTELLVGIDINSKSKDASDVNYQPKDVYEADDADDLKDWLEEGGFAIPDLFGSETSDEEMATSNDYLDYYDMEDDSDYDSDYDSDVYDYSEDDFDFSDYNFDEDEY